MIGSRVEREHFFRGGEPSEPVFLLLHGIGGSPAELVMLARALNSGATVLAPKGQVSQRGTTRWFRGLVGGGIDTDDLIVRVDQLAEFVSVARSHYGLTDRRMVAVAFSNGANIAAALMLLRPTVIREAILFAGMSPLSDQPLPDLSGNRVFLSSGEQDPVAPPELADRLVTTLEGRGAEVDWHRHGRGHQITPEAVHQARDWLRDP